MTFFVLTSQLHLWNLKKQVFIDTTQLVIQSRVIVKDAPQDAYPGIRELSHCGLFTQAFNINTNPTIPHLLRATHVMFTPEQ